jgi:regulator of protease activity HflC (stomatin/prohibitin superfamily)
VWHGLVWKLPVLQSISTINTTPQIVDLRAQSVTTKDRATIAVSGAIEYEVCDPVQAIYGVFDFNRNIQSGALGIIAHFLNQAENWRVLAPLAPIPPFPTNMQ